MKATICLFLLKMVIVLNKNSLNDLFKPYELEFMDIEDLNKVLNVSDEFVMEVEVEMECSKSKNGLCNNRRCDYNLVSKHSDALYIELANAGDS